MDIRDLTNGLQECVAFLVARSMKGQRFGLINQQKLPKSLYIWAFLIDLYE